MEKNPKPTINTLWKIATGLQVPICTIQATNIHTVLKASAEAYLWMTAATRVSLQSVKAAGLDEFFNSERTNRRFLLKDTAPIPWDLFEQA